MSEPNDTDLRGIYETALLKKAGYGDPMMSDCVHAGRLALYTAGQKSRDAELAERDARIGELERERDDARLVAAAARAWLLAPEAARHSVTQMLMHAVEGADWSFIDNDPTLAPSPQRASPPNPAHPPRAGAVP